MEEVDENGVATKVKTKKVETAPPDWMENDSAKPGYIKNRTHYSQLEDAVFTSSESNSEISFEGVPFKAGDVVSIVVDGEQITMVAKSGKINDFEYPYIGDPIGNPSDEYGWTYFFDDHMQENIIISYGIKTFNYKYWNHHRLPQKYSPITITSYGRNEKGGIYNDPVIIDEIEFDASFNTYNLNHIESVISYSEDHSKAKLTLCGRNNVVNYVSQTYIPIAMVFDVTNTTLNSTNKWIIKSANFSNTEELLALPQIVYLNSIYINGIKHQVPCTFAGIETNKARYLTGTCVTIEGHLYCVTIDTNSSSSKTLCDQDWVLTIKRIV